jgi:hypothetical protein
MLKLLTTDAFASWFSALPAGPAEDVAATLEVVVQLGTRTEAPGSSDALLWYEHPSVAHKAWPADPRKDLPLEVVKLTQDWGRFGGYVTRIIKHLESPTFAARLARLSAEDAATVLAAVKRIRRTSTTRYLAWSAFQVKKRFFIREAPSARDAMTVAGLIDESEVRDAYFSALAAAGFEVADVPPRPAALREITLRQTAPGLRLLYGIDESHNRGLVVLGEWLDRSFYGDSVRVAEALWGQFLEGHPLPLKAAGAR